jgi:hypothetical protein
MIRLKETTTFFVESPEQATLIAKMYDDLHALIICGTSHHVSEIEEVDTDRVVSARKPLCLAEGPREAQGLCVRDHGHSMYHEDIKGGTWPV